MGGKERDINRDRSKDSKDKDRGSKDSAGLTRTTPTLDLFGKSRRESSIEVDRELKELEEKKEREERGRQRRLGGKQSDSKSPVLGRKSPADRKVSGIGDRKASGDRKSPSDFLGRKGSAGE